MSAATVRRRHTCLMAALVVPLGIVWLSASTQAQLPRPQFRPPPIPQFRPPIVVQPPRFETVWTCSRCGRELGRGTKPSIATCPYCGTNFINGSNPFGNQPRTTRPVQQVPVNNSPPRGNVNPVVPPVTARAKEDPPADPVKVVKADTANNTGGGPSATLFIILALVGAVLAGGSGTMLLLRHKAEARRRR